MSLVHPAHRQLLFSCKAISCSSRSPPLIHSSQLITVKDVLRTWRVSTRYRRYSLKVFAHRHHTPIERKLRPRTCCTVTLQIHCMFQSTRLGPHKQRTKRTQQPRNNVFDQNVSNASTCLDFGICTSIMALKSHVHTAPFRHCAAAAGLVNSHQLTLIVSLDTLDKGDRERQAKHKNRRAISHKKTCAELPIRLR